MYSKAIKPSTWKLNTMQIGKTVNHIIHFSFRDFVKISALYHVFNQKKISSHKKKF